MCEIQVPARLMQLKDGRSVRLLKLASWSNGIPNVSIDFLLFYVPTAAFRRAANRRLQAHFPDRSVQVWRSTRTWQSRLAPNRPRHSAGVNLLMRYMEWSCALYRAVQEHGMSQAEAGALVETIMSDVFQPVPAALFKLSRLRSAKQEARVKWLLGMQIRYFFTSPFRHRAVPSKTGVAFDVVLCPLANYFKDQGVPSSPGMRRVTWTTAWRANMASTWFVRKPSPMALRIATSDGNSRQWGRIDAKFGCLS